MQELNCKSSGRKSSEHFKILMNAFFKYNGHWEEEHFRSLVILTGYKKK